MMRIGIGYDVHAFEQDRALIVGGVHIPYERGLAGHSDADVLTHAIMDALLGAMREGDIGAHFPDNDPQYAGADSIELLSRVSKLLWEKNWEIVDIDTVIVAQQPKLSPYRDQMRAAIATALKVDVEQVGIKATTTEGLGFEGRGEGIAAHAVVMLNHRGNKTIPC
jgi:2-C-methyl-D-erythritol 2,4-cyclodiphosphate synthase